MFYRANMIVRKKKYRHSDNHAYIVLLENYSGTVS